MIRQLQLFVRNDRDVIVLTYSYTAQDWPRFQAWVYKSINTLKLGTQGKQPTTTVKAEPEKEATPINTIDAESLKLIGDGLRKKAE